MSQSESVIPYPNSSTNINNAKDILIPDIIDNIPDLHFYTLDGSRCTIPSDDVKNYIIAKRNRPGENNLNQLPSEIDSNTHNKGPYVNLLTLRKILIRKLVNECPDLVIDELCTCGKKFPAQIQWWSIDVILEKDDDQLSQSQTSNQENANDQDKDNNLNVTVTNCGLSPSDLNEKKIIIPGRFLPLSDFTNTNTFCRILIGDIQREDLLENKLFLKDVVEKYGLYADELTKEPGPELIEMRCSCCDENRGKRIAGNNQDDDDDRASARGGFVWDSDSSD